MSSIGCGPTGGLPADEILATGTMVGWAPMSSRRQPHAAFMTGSQVTISRDALLDEAVRDVLQWDMDAHTGTRAAVVTV